jgi:predicted nucleic acid-binding protein
MAVLDTNILVDLIRKHHRRASLRAVEIVRRLLSDRETPMTTRFNAAELYVGAELADDPREETARIDACLESLQILDFDDAAARVYGRIEASLRGAGRPVGDFDALIASVAIRHGQLLVTRNPRHFDGIAGLAVRGLA